LFLDAVNHTTSPVSCRSNGVVRTRHQLHPASRSKVFILFLSACSLKNDALEIDSQTVHCLVPHVEHRGLGTRQYDLRPFRRLQANKLSIHEYFQRTLGSCSLPPSSLASSLACQRYPSSLDRTPSTNFEDTERMPHERASLSSRDRRYRICICIERNRASILRWEKPIWLSRLVPVIRYNTRASGTNRTHYWRAEPCRNTPHRRRQKLCVPRSSRLRQLAARKPRRSLHVQIQTPFFEVDHSTGDRSRTSGV
jgi:hypothetical protein